MLKRIEERLIDDWKGAWKLWSVQLNAAGLVLMGLGEAAQNSWGALPASLVDKVPHAQAIGMAMFILGLVARVLKQPTKS